MTKQKPKFLRVDSHKYSKLGRRRKKKQVYRKPKGIDNKIRLNRAGRLRKVKPGFRTSKKTRGLINGKIPVLVHNVNDLKNLKKDNIGIIARIGEKKKIEIAEHAEKENIEFHNFDPKKFLEQAEIKRRIAKEQKAEKEQKKKVKEKKAKEKQKEKEKETVEKTEKEIAKEVSETAKEQEEKEKEVVEKAVEKVEKAVDKIKEKTEKETKEEGK
jgi:large subunit ribosomal protein L32e